MMTTAVVVVVVVVGGESGGGKVAKRACFPLGVCFPLGACFICLPKCVEPKDDHLQIVPRQS